MTVGGVVMAHRRRAEWAEQLSAELGLPIVFDRVDDRHETGLRCLEAGLDSEASHWLIVQDDAIAAVDLIVGLEQAVTVSQDRIVGLYVGNVRPEARRSTEAVKQAKAAGVSWLALPGPWWGVGLVIPTIHLPDLVAHYRASREQNYDRRIATWARQAKVECWYTVPSLVDHRSGIENPSLIAGRTSPTRTARWFCDGSALDVDWTRTPLVPHLLWRHVRNGRIVKVRAHTPQFSKVSESGLYEPVVEKECGACGSSRYLTVEEARRGPFEADDVARHDHAACR